MMAEHPRKTALRGWLNAWDIEAIQAEACRQSRMLSLLLALTYDSDDLVSWRAVEAYGLAAAQVAIADAEFVRNQLRRLVWLLRDESGGIGWRAPELIGETLFHCHAKFQDYIPILVSLLDMEAQDAVRFRAGYLWAIGRVALVISEQIQGSIPFILPCLHDRFPQIRGLAAWVIGRIAPEMAIAQLTHLLADGAVFLFYQDHELSLTSVAELARCALAGYLPVN
jgi:HEAT repeat protein